MVAELLVEQLYADGHLLIKALPVAGVRVAVAAWVRFAEDDEPLLYIGTPAVATGLRNAVQAVIDCLSRLPGSVVDSTMVRLVQPTDPVARDLTNIRDRSPVLSVRLRVSRLGDRSAYEVYVYPKGGRMNAKEVLDAVTTVMRQAGEALPVTVVLDDGSTRRAVPVGLRLKDGVVHITWLDPVTKAEETRPVGQVFSIEV